MNIIDEILHTLNYNQNMLIDEITEYFGISVYSCNKILNFLERYNLIKLHDSQVEISEQAKTLFIKTSSLSSEIVAEIYNTKV